MFSASHTDTSWDLGVTAEKVGYYNTHIGYQFYFDEKRRHPSQMCIRDSGWPLGRGPAQYPADTAAVGEWHHSDVRAVAYTFTYKLFDQIVTVGSLK